MKQRVRKLFSVRGDEAGAVLVEAGLAIPLFVIIVLGAIGWGYFFTKQIILTYATQFSSRCAAIQGNGSSMDFCGIYNVSLGNYGDYGAEASMGLQQPASFTTSNNVSQMGTYFCVDATPNNPLGFLGGISLPVADSSIPLAIPMRNSASFCTSAQ